VLQFPENLIRKSDYLVILKGLYSAKEERIGKLNANRGSPCLDKIGKPSFQMQAKLLSAIQNQKSCAVLVPIGYSVDIIGPAQPTQFGTKW